jgi:hypothetical protein
VKDLPDIALLAQLGSLQALDLRAALEATFRFRATHALPAVVPTPPSSWAPKFERMAREDDLPWRTLVELMSAVHGFLDPVLAGVEARWDPEPWSWRGS